MASRKRAAEIDPTTAREAMLKAIAAADSPVAVKTLASMPELPRKATIKEVHAWLAGDLNLRVFKWGASQYWNRDEASAARTRLLEIAAAEILTAAELKKRAGAIAPKIKTTVLGSALAGLTRDKRLLKEGARLVNAERPEVFLEAEIAGLLGRFGMARSSAEIRVLLSGEKESPSVRAVADKIFEAMNRIALSPGSTVTFYRLRQQPELANITKSIFDEAALLLQNERRALLSIHDHASALPEEERSRFVTDGLGKYYVSIYAR